MARLRFDVAEFTVVAFADALAVMYGAAAPVAGAFATVDEGVGVAVLGDSDGAGIGVTVGDPFPVGDAVGTAVSSGSADPASMTGGGVGIAVEFPASAVRCMKPVTSGGRMGAANPTTKSAIQAITPIPTRPLMIRSPSIAPPDSRW